MKISYRTHPALKFLETDKPQFAIHPNEKVMPGIEMQHDLNDSWRDMRLKCKKNIIVASIPFCEAVIKSGEKFTKNQIQKELGEISGVICWGKNLLFFDSIRVDIINDLYKVRIIFCCGEFIRIAFLENTAFVSSFEYDIAVNPVEMFYRFAQDLLLFKKYATVETEYLPAMQRVNGIDCKYLNDTSADITYLDCKWFTTLVKSDAFKVRGHFRLQPKKKDGEWTKELIWINEFLKDGYTAPARILNA